MAESIVVDFQRPVPLFPLGETVLLPHAVQALHVFEPRYRQMVEACLAEVRAGSVLTARPIAMATVEPSVRGRRQALPDLRPAVCVGQIVRHERRADGRHDIVLHGVCRARIVELIEPDGRTLYRQAVLRPIEPPGRAVPRMPEARRALREMLQRPRVRRLASVKAVSAWAERGDLPTHAVIEVIGAALVQDEPTRYALLECADPWARARLVAEAIDRLERVVSGAERQQPGTWPKGLSWN
jgi:Lon protease-like protein